MGKYDVIFHSIKPNLSNSQFIMQLTELFKINWRNVILLLIYCIALLALDNKIIHWITKGFTVWHNQTMLSWGIMTLFTLLIMLPLWRLKEEEGPHLIYNLPSEKITSLVPTQARVTQQGMNVAIGRPMGSRKIYWRIDGTDGSTITDSTPYLPTSVTMNTPVDTKVWVGVDPTRKSQPLFLGFEK